MNKLPVIHCIANSVTGNDCANILLAAGFSPIMAEEPQEMEDIAEASDAFALNLGTPSDRKYEAALIAGKAYNRLGKPVVIDPVGIGVSSYRRIKLSGLLKELQPDILRCNLGEARTLLSMLREPGAASNARADEICGVDSRESASDQALKTAKELAGLMNCVVLISGKEDAVSDGINAVSIPGGSDKLKQITGSGCMLTVVTAAFCTLKNENGDNISAYEAATRASKFFKNISGKAEKLLSENGASGELRMRLIDAASITEK